MKIKEAINGVKDIIQVKLREISGKLRETLRESKPSGKVSFHAHL